MIRLYMILETLHQPHRQTGEDVLLHHVDSAHLNFGPDIRTQLKHICYQTGALEFGNGRRRAGKTFADVGGQVRYLSIEWMGAKTVSIGNFENRFNRKGTKLDGFLF